MKKIVLIFSLLLNVVFICSSTTLLYLYKDKVYEALGLKSKVDVVMYGDSITAEGNWDSLFPGVDIVNSGMSGNTTSGLIKSLKVKVLNYEPNVCFLEGGINDILDGIATERTIRNYSTLVDSLTTHEITPILQSVILTTDSSLNTRVDTLNNALKAIAIKKKLIFLDLNEKLAQRGFLKAEFSRDSFIHLNKTAYPVWAEIIRTNIPEFNARRAKP